MVWSIPSFTEGTTSMGAAVIDSISLDGEPEFIEVVGNQGLVVGLQPLLATSNGGGGTKRDDEMLTVTCKAGALTGKSWPAPNTVVTISGAPAPWDRINTNWLCMSDPLSATQKAHGTITLKFKRYCEITLA
jgi:hypothetical protein